MKGGKKMGTWGLGWFMDDEIAKWKAFRDIVVSPTEKALIDKHIAELEEKKKAFESEEK
jgi:hypothetical protein